MNDDLLARRLRELAAEPEPRPAFLDELHDQLAAELGLGTRRVRSGATVGDRPRGAAVAQGRGARRVRFLLAAALLVAGVTAAALVGARLLSPDPDLMSVIRSRGQVRAGVTSGYPQVVPRAGGPAGFDVDLVQQLAWGFGIEPQLIVVPGDQLVSEPGAWDLAVVPTTDLASSSGPVVVSTPVLAWPVEVLVPAGATATSLDDLQATRLCVVDGSAGARWAVGRDTGAVVIASAPPVATIISLPSDDGCQEALDAGRADAYVTDALGPADLAMRPHLRSLAGPVLQVPRVVAIAADGPDPTALRAAVDAAIERMRADGTLRDLSLRRLGADLTSIRQP